MGDLFEHGFALRTRMLVIDDKWGQGCFLSPYRTS